MNRIFTALSAIAPTTIAIATAVAIAPAYALENRTSVTLVDPVKATELTLDVTLETANDLVDNTVITTEITTDQDALGLPRLSLEQVADSLQVNQGTVDEAIITRFNTNKPASANGIVYQFE